MAQKIYPGDVVFPVDATGAFDAGASNVAPQVSAATSFSSRARAVSHYSGWSVIADFSDAGAQGKLSVWVTNADFAIRGDGEVGFFGPVVWVQKTQSIVDVGGSNTGPYEIEVPFNSSHAMQLRYEASSGDGTMMAKLGGVSA